MRTAPCLVFACVMTATAVAQQPPVESTVTVPQVHKTKIIPASGVIFDVGGETPKTTEQWTVISNAGVALAESGNLMMRVSPPKDRTKWITLSRQLATAGRAARKAAEAKNVGALMRTSDRLIIACETCHATFRTQATVARTSE